MKYPNMNKESETASVSRVVADPPAPGPEGRNTHCRGRQAPDKMP